MEQIKTLILLVRHLNNSMGQRKILHSPCQRILHQNVWGSSNQNFLCTVRTKKNSLVLSVLTDIVNKSFQYNILHSELFAIDEKRKQAIFNWRLNTCGMCSPYTKLSFILPGQETRCIYVNNKQGPALRPPWKSRVYVLFGMGLKLEIKADGHWESRPVTVAAAHQPPGPVSQPGALCCHSKLTENWTELDHTGNPDLAVKAGTELPSAVWGCFLVPYSTAYPAHYQRCQNRSKPWSLEASPGS